MTGEVTSWGRSSPNGVEVGDALTGAAACVEGSTVPSTVESEPHAAAVAPAVAAIRSATRDLRLDMPAS